MHFSPKAALLGMATLAALGLAALPQAAHAQATQITSASGLAAGDATLTYSGSGFANGALVTSYTGSAGGTNVTFTDTGNILFESQAQPTISAFATGTNLLGTFNSSGAKGPLTITFSQGFSQFGLSAQDNTDDIETFTFTPYSGLTALMPFTVGPLDNTSTAGALAFLGASVSTGSITSVVISSVSSVAGSSNAFIVGPLTFGSPAPAPEPCQSAVLGLGCLGLTGLAFKARRRRSVA